MSLKFDFGREYKFFFHLDDILLIAFSISMFQNALVPIPQLNSRLRLVFTSIQNDTCMHATLDIFQFKFSHTNITFTFQLITIPGDHW